MKWWTDIRRKVLVEQVSKRKIMAEYSIHAKTLEKILSNPEPPGYRMNRPRPKPVVGPFLGRIEEILKQDRELPRKQRHTAKRIFDRAIRLPPGLVLHQIQGRDVESPNRLVVFLWYFERSDSYNWTQPKSSIRYTMENRKPSQQATISYI